MRFCRVAHPNYEIRTTKYELSTTRCKFTLSLPVVSLSNQVESVEGPIHTSLPTARFGGGTKKNVK